MSDLIVSGNCPKCGTVNQRKAQTVLYNGAKRKLSALAAETHTKCQYCGTAFSIATPVSAKIFEVLLVVAMALVIPVLLLVALIIWKNFFF